MEIAPSLQSAKTCHLRPRSWRAEPHTARCPHPGAVASVLITWPRCPAHRTSLSQRQRTWAWLLHLQPQDPGEASKNAFASVFLFCKTGFVRELVPQSCLRMSHGTWCRAGEGCHCSLRVRVRPRRGRGSSVTWRTQLCISTGPGVPARVPLSPADQTLPAGLSPRPEGAVRLSPRSEVPPPAGLLHLQTPVLGLTCSRFSSC